jgi:EmrB/QacA subfamily drug resistance transporter
MNLISLLTSTRPPAQPRMRAAQPRMRAAQPRMSADRRRWVGLLVVCLAQLMIVLDTTIVNVALPSIQRDLHFTQDQLSWVINAFLITFGSLLLLAGRLGDLVGRRRVFLAGLTIFTLASIVCGSAPTQAVLIAARFVQGVGAAMQGSAILAIIVTQFPKPQERAKAMSAYVFTAVAGGSLGLLAGGALTEALSWHWIFFVNVPIGLLTFVAARVLIPRDPGSGLGDGIDWLGSVLVTAALMSGVYAIVEAAQDGWGSGTVLGFGGLAVALVAAFLFVESAVGNPIMPLRILRSRGLITSSVVRGFLVTGMYSTFFLGTLYLEHVLHYSPLQTGLAWLPWTLTVAALSTGLSARLVARFGPMPMLIAGMAAVVAGLGLLQTTGLHSQFLPTMFASFFLVGLGIGSAFMPLLTIAMADIPAADAGLASGIVNVSQQVAGALGLAVLSTIAASRSRLLAASRHGAAASLLGGDRLAFGVGALVVAAGAVLALVILPRPQRSSAPAAEPAVSEPARLHREPLPAELEREAA